MSILDQRSPERVGRKVGDVIVQINHFNLVLEGVIGRKQGSKGVKTSKNVPISREITI